MSEDIEPTTKQKGSLLAVIDDIVMMALALVSAVLLLVESLWSLPLEYLIALERADLIIALIFLIEFTVRLRISENKILFLKRFWWELFAAIPLSTETTQALRLLRLLRISQLGLHLQLLLKNDPKLSEYRITH